MLNQHNTPRTSTNPLPQSHPDQLPLPGIPELPKARYLLLVTLGKLAAQHRVPISVTAAILLLFLAGQGTLATGAIFGVALFLVNRSIDHRMTGGDQ